MSLDPGNLARSSSPASSDASIPRNQHRVFEDDLKRDKNYRRYASHVERALSLFDTALQEWADYISFLSRLLKALQSHPPSLAVVPEKITVAKRLAQCLNPALPSGVHQKALEVYGYIFGLLKPDGLARDLSLYFPGIAPTLTFASLSVRPLFLSLIETYVVNLTSSCIRPALKAILLSLLPGLEEETSEDFETTLRIINKFKDISESAGKDSGSQADGQYFWQCLFLASITNPTRRMGVLAFLNRHLPKLGGSVPQSAPSKSPRSINEVELSASIASLTSPEPGLLIRCFATGLTDSQFLVQRNFLDLLVTHLPLHSPVLQTHINADDLELLIAAAAGVVVRRDMSLNRRLWVWFLGPDVTNDNAETGDAGEEYATGERSSIYSESQYFTRFGLKPLVRSIKRMIARDSVVPQERTKPFRISLSLMDRWRIGGLIVPEVFLPILRSVQEYKRTTTSKINFEDVFRSASAFFDGVESSLIFSELLNLVLRPYREGVSDSTLLDLQLVHFTISNFNIREEEMLTIHTPHLLLGTLISTKALLLSKQESELHRLVLDEASSISHQLLGLISNKAFVERLPSDLTQVHELDTQAMVSDDALTKLDAFYTATRNSLDGLASPFNPKNLAENLLWESQSQVLNTLQSEGQQLRLKEQMNFLIALLKKIPHSAVVANGDLFKAIHERLLMANNTKSIVSMSALFAISSLVTALCSAHSNINYLSLEQVCDLVPLLVEQLWEYLSPTSPKFHVEAVRCLWMLHSISWRDHLVEAAVSSLMISSRPTSSHSTVADGVERFFVLWNHSYQASSGRSASRGIGENLFDHNLGRDPQSAYRLSLLQRPLFITLDLLPSSTNGICLIVKHWIQDPSTAFQVLNIVISKLSKFSYLNLETQSDDKSHPSQEDGSQCLYLLKMVSNIISALNLSGWSALTSKGFPTSNRQVLNMDAEGSLSLQISLAQLCTQLLKNKRAISSDPDFFQGERLQEFALVILHQLLLGPGAEILYPLYLDTFLIEELSSCLDANETGLQSSMIDSILPALKIRFSHDTKELSNTMTPKNQRKSSLETLSQMSRLSFSGERSDKDYIISHLPQPPSQLLPCLLKGIRSQSSRSIIDKWVHFLTECLPLYLGMIFQVLLKLVESLCKEIDLAYQELQLMFQNVEGSRHNRSEHVTVALLAALENCIVTAHDRLLLEEAHIAGAKPPDQPQSFFGNMVSGVFAAEANQIRSSIANDRLTVLLCFQDGVRLCYSIWAWGDTGRSKDSRGSECYASFQYTSLRMRNRARRILEHLFTAETLECLETLIELWRTSIDKDNGVSGRTVFNLLHTLEGSRPKAAIPAIFNAIYSRNNPNALDPGRKSSMTSHLTEADLAAFLVTYARSLDDDVLDEIWLDCITFLRDVLGNPFPHRQILSRLLEFVGILGEKMERTTFGDDQRAKKDLGDILLRLLSAISTTKPIGSSQDPSLPRTDNDPSNQGRLHTVGPDDIYSVLSAILPALITILGEDDRITSAMSAISTSILAPMFHSRLFPQTLTGNMLHLLQQMSKVPGASKFWRKDVADAFNDPKFFSTKLSLVKNNWLGLLRQWTLTDKDRFPELLSRLTQPAAAGIMFGVGASAARLEADRKSQLNLRRIALLIIAADEDHFTGDLSALQQKLEDLLTATHVSSPSSATRAEIYMLLRALILRTSTTHLAQFWPMINTELRSVMVCISTGRDKDTYNPYSLLQACKLLESLLLTAPDDFQLQEWLFVTDTIDVIYPPDRWDSVALADEISQVLGTGATDSGLPFHEASERDEQFNRLRLGTDLSRETAKDEIVDRLLRPFFTRLSIHAFERTYSMTDPDLTACKDDLMADLFNDFTVAG